MGTQIEELPNEKLYNLIVAYLEKLYGEYNFTQMDMNEFSNIAMSSIEKTLEKYIPKNEKELAKCIKKASTLALDNHIRKMMKDEQVCLSFTINYINDKITPVKNQTEALNQFKNIVKFIRKYIGISGLFFDLIKSSSKLDEILTHIVEYYKDIITDGKVRDLFKDDISISLIEAYCINNNIEIKESISEDELSDYIKRVEDSFFEDNIKLYFQDVGRTKMLSRLEEERIAYAALEGDKEAIKILAESHLRYAIKIAKKYRGRGLLFLDLIQEGNMGLLRAAEKFDVRRGYRFKTYAEWWIKQRIRLAIANNSRNIRIPYTTFYQVEKYKRTKKGMASETGREPSIEEVAKFMRISVKKAQRLEKAMYNTTSLNEYVDDDEETEKVVFIADDSPGTAQISITRVLSKETQELLSRVKLTENELMVLVLRYGLNGDRPFTLLEIADILKKSSQRIQQIHARALAKLRMYKDIKEFANYTDDANRAIEYIDYARKQYIETGNYYKQIVMK